MMKLLYLLTFLSLYINVRVKEGISEAAEKLYSRKFAMLPVDEETTNYQLPTS